jgi:hypothetical protein
VLERFFTLETVACAFDVWAAQIFGRSEVDQLDSIV